MTVHEQPEIGDPSPRILLQRKVFPNSALSAGVENFVAVKSDGRNGPLGMVISTQMKRASRSRPSSLPWLRPSRSRWNVLPMDTLSLVDFEYQRFHGRLMALSPSCCRFVHRPQLAVYGCLADSEQPCSFEGSAIRSLEGCHDHRSLHLRHSRKDSRLWNLR